MVVTYHKINESAEGLGSLGTINPFFALWIPFVLFAALIIRMYYVLAHTPGGEPIGGLDRGFGKMTAALRKFFARFVPMAAG